MSSSHRVLFLPLSNVLGHLTRTFSLVEQLLDCGVDVHIAMNHHYDDLFEILPEGIAKHSTIEIPQASTRSFGTITSYQSGAEHDLVNIEKASNIGQKELQLRSHYLKQMLVEDRRIVHHTNPDLIITDYRYTTSLMPEFSSEKVFHISNILGCPSFYKRTRGKYAAPLDKGNLLVPGIRSIEEADNGEGSDSRIHWCGPFRWKGWERLQSSDSEETSSDIFLCFGSTGNSSKIIPWLLENISGDYQISMVGDAKEHENSEAFNFGSLEQCLTKTKVVCCHGGHGTVMECIRHKKPMIIFPHNIEQLEIGRRIHDLGLGILIAQPFETLHKSDLNELINSLFTNETVKQNLKDFSTQLKQVDGPKIASSIILNSLQ